MNSNAESPMSGHTTKGPPKSQEITSMASPRSGKQLPTEIISLILSYLQQDRDYKSLAAVARTRRSFYDLAIPMIYGTVVVNERNSTKLEYGYSSRQPSEENGVEPKQTPTRKDIAAAHTRKITFDSSPTGLIFDHFRKVEVVAITSRCFQWIMDSHDTYTNFTMLALGIASIGAVVSDSAPLHLVFHAVDDSQYIRLLDEVAMILYPMTFEFRDMPITVDSRRVMGIAIRLRAVVQFSSDHSLDPEDTAESLASLLESCFPDKALRDISGQLYLCNIPQLVLTPEELTSANAAGNANDVARLKMINITASKGATTPVVISKKWDQFAPKVQYVEFGFRGSLAEAETVLRERRKLGGLSPPNM